MTSATDTPIALRHRLTVRLTAGVTLALLLVGIPFLLAFHRMVRQQQLEALAEATEGLNRVVVDALRSAMLAGHPHLLDETVRNLVLQDEVERVLLLDHEGRVRVASDLADEGRVLRKDDPTSCGACHRNRDPPSNSATVGATGERRVLRTMTLIPNDAPCHGCHDPAASNNGILLVDLALGAADRRFFANIGSTVALGGVMVVLTVAVLVWLLREMVHKPLQAIVTVSQRVVEGDLDARAEVSPPGEFGRLANRLNHMTEYLARSIRQVESQHRELQAILDAVDDEIVVLDRERRIVAANAAFRSRLREPSTELAGRPCHDVDRAQVPCGAESPGGCPVQRVFETGRLHKGIVSYGEADGKERVIEIHASPLRGADGSIHQAVEVRRDISERREMEAILAHSEQLASLGLLASGLSHEINNPLAAITTSVDGMRRRLPAEPGVSPEAAGRLEQFLQRIGQEVQRGRTITHRLLRLARPAGTARGLVDVNLVVRDITGVLVHALDKARIHSELELADRLPPLRGDESRLGQVLMNVMLNAIQAMGDRGGRLRVVTSCVDEAVRIHISDTGGGIRPELLKRIFDPFFTTKPAGKGTGLGLFIAHQIVAEAGGTIEVSSEPGRGTTVIVELPCAPKTSRP